MSTPFPSQITFPILDALIDDCVHNAVKYYFWPFWILGEMDSLLCIQQDLYNATMDGSLLRMFSVGKN